MPRRVRLDAELVAQGLFATQDEAMRAVMAGDVSTSDRRLERPGEQVVPGIELHVRARERGDYASRGALKLERGLDYFGIDPRGLSCLDVGCSSGGFTDVLLRRGAAHVLAVDVGYAQFDWRLRGDVRVTLLERTDIRSVPAPERAGSIDLAVCDVSFVSVTSVLGAVCELLAPHGSFLTLVKPQFEVAHADVGEGGVVRSPQAREQAVERVRMACERAGLAVRGVCESPVRGHKGNVEYLLLGVR